MSWLPILVDDSDAATVVRWLNDEPEIAFLVGDGPKRWKAVKVVDHLVDGEHRLWQHTGDPLNLLLKQGPDEVIPNPWRGWRERRAGADPTIPYFGAGHPSLFELELRTRHRRYSRAERRQSEYMDSRLMGPKDVLLLSTFGWIRDRYQKAPQATHRCWRRLRAWVSRSAAGLAASGETFWAFPSALAKLQGGMDYYANGFDLSDGLRALRRSHRLTGGRGS